MHSQTACELSLGFDFCENCTKKGRPLMGTHKIDFIINGVRLSIEMTKIVLKGYRNLHIGHNQQNAM